MNGLADKERYNQALHWIVTWLEARNPSVEVTPDTRFYIDGLVDSFGIVELISDAEDNFAILFSSAAMASPAFQTVAGLAEAIAQPSLAA